MSFESPIGNMMQLHFLATPFHGCHKPNSGIDPLPDQGTHLGCPHIRLHHQDWLNAGLLLHPDPLTPTEELEGCRGYQKEKLSSDVASYKAILIN
jgi:hypothetical protein